MAVFRCYVCDKRYSACPTCDDLRFRPWLKVACCREHYQVRQTFLKYRDGEICADEAREMLEQMGVTSPAGMNETYKKFYAEVFPEGASAF